MKKLIIAIILAAFPLFGQVVNSIKVTPFINFGSYDNKTTSASFSVYSSLNLFNYDYFSIGFDQLKIDNIGWDYEQSLYVAGYTTNLYPFYLSFNYGYLSGDYSAKGFPFIYSDDINIYNGKVVLNSDLLFLSGSFSYLNIRGFDNLLSRQAEGSLTYVPSINLSLGISVIGTNQTDGRNFVGGELFISYKPIKKVALIANAFMGERAYYFNPDLFTIFNQNDTQEGNYKFQLDYFISPLLSVSGVYQHSIFSNYTINYFSIGLSYLIKT